MKLKWMLILISMFFLMGCCTIKIVKENPQMTVEQYERFWAAMRERSIKLGMSKQEVLDILGEPQVFYQCGKSCPGDEVWEYTSKAPGERRGGLYPHGVISRPIQIWFRNDIVTKVNRIVSL